MPVIKRLELSGFLLSLGIGITAYLLSGYISIVNAVILALLIGVILGNTISLPKNMLSGIRLTSNRFLEFSILFLAFGISYSHFTELGLPRFMAVFVMILVVILLTVYLARRFNCPGASGWLIGFGTAICGSSAIAALAPSLNKRQEDTGMAMAVVNMYGALGMLFMPWVLQFLPITSQDAGFLIGASLHSVANVAGAAFSIDQATGEAAITIKLARVALLSPGLIFISWLLNRNNPDRKSVLHLPWYMYGFILITLFVSFQDLPEQVLTWAETLGKLSLTIALAAVGLSIHMRSIYTTGRQGLGFGFIIFFIQILILILALFVIRIF